MEMDEFISNFAAQFNETDAQAIEAGTRFHEIAEWSSIIALSVIAMVDEEYQIKLRGEDLRAAETVEDIFCIVKERAAGNP